MALSRLEASMVQLPQVSFFCTLGGAGSEQALADMQAIAGKPARAPRRLVPSDRYAGSITSFAKELGLISRAATIQANVA